MQKPNVGHDVLVHAMTYEQTQRRTHAITIDTIDSWRRSSCCSRIRSEEGS